MSSWDDWTPKQTNTELQRVPSSISIPFKQVCQHLELPTVATYAGVCLWNWKAIFDDERLDSLDNLSTLATFTGSLDESWFYLVSVAMEARGGPMISLMLEAVAAARVGDTRAVTESLRCFAERLDELGTLMQKMYENCDPHVFYHRIRPFLAGGKNMAEAGLPNGVMFDTGSGDDVYCHYGGGSNAQSSMIQFFDMILGVEHHPTGSHHGDSSSTESEAEINSRTPPSSRHNFIHEMRAYMPGPHRRFLSRVATVANIRDYVDANRSNRPLTIAYDACLAMLRALRDKHMQMVSRYIVVKSHESRSHTRSISPRAAPNQPQLLNLANAHKSSNRLGNRRLRGTGGTALIPFLKQARDETGEPAVDDWFRRTLRNGQLDGGAGRGPSAERAFASLDKLGEHADGELEIVGLSGVWRMDDSEGGICHW